MHTDREMLHRVKDMVLDYYEPQDRPFDSNRAPAYMATIRGYLAAHLNTAKEPAVHAFPPADPRLEEMSLEELIAHNRDTERLIRIRMSQDPAYAQRIGEIAQKILEYTREVE